MSRDRKIFAVMEFHRGEWIEVMTKDKDGNKVPKVCKTSVENAEMMNIDANAQVKEKGSTTMFRYEETSRHSKNEETDFDKMKRPQLIRELVNRAIKMKSDYKNPKLIELLKDYESEINKDETQN